MAKAFSLAHVVPRFLSQRRLNGIGLRHVVDHAKTLQQFAQIAGNKRRDNFLAGFRGRRQPIVMPADHLLLLEHRGLFDNSRAHQGFSLPRSRGN